MAHPNARLTPHGRRLLADRILSGWTITAAAGAAGISRQTGSKWWCRAQAGVLTPHSWSGRGASMPVMGSRPLDFSGRRCARRAMRPRAAVGQASPSFEAVPADPLVARCPTDALGPGRTGTVHPSPTTRSIRSWRPNRLSRAVRCATRASLRFGASTPRTVPGGSHLSTTPLRIRRRPLDTAGHGLSNGAGAHDAIAAGLFRPVEGSIGPSQQRRPAIPDHESEYEIGPLGVGQAAIGQRPPRRVMPRSRCRPGPGRVRRGPPPRRWLWTTP